MLLSLLCTHGPWLETFEIYVSIRRKSEHGNPSLRSIRQRHQTSRVRCLEAADRREISLSVKNFKLCRQKFYEAPVVDYGMTFSEGRTAIWMLCSPQTQTARPGRDSQYLLPHDASQEAPMSSYARHASACYCLLSPSLGRVQRR